jgi:uncharacterized protein with GYD domain
VLACGGQPDPPPSSPDPAELPLAEDARDRGEHDGGSLESFYFAFGKTNGYVLLDLPDNRSAAAASMVVHAAGGATTEVVVLLTPEEIDGAAKLSVDYRPPGS